MALPISDGSFTTWAAQGPLLSEAAFEDQPTTRIYTQEWVGLIASYTQPALGTANSSVGNAYFVADSPINHLGGGIGSVMRKWAQIPTTRTRYESYPFEYPSFTGSVAYGTGITILRASAGITGRVVLALASNPFTLGQNVFIRASGEYGNTNGFFRFSWCSPFKVLEMVGSHITIGGSVFGQMKISGTVSDATYVPGRTTSTVKIVASKVQNDYWLPGVTQGIVSDADVPITQPWQAIDSTGSETKALTTTTVPTAAQYQASVAAQEWLAVEFSSRLWLGQVIERMVRYVPAI